MKVSIKVSKFIITVLTLINFCAQATILQEVILEKQQKDGTVRRITLYSDAHETSFNPVSNQGQVEAVTSVIKKAHEQNPRTRAYLEVAPREFFNLFKSISDFTYEYSQKLLEHQAALKNKLKAAGALGQETAQDLIKSAQSSSIQGLFEDELLYKLAIQLNLQEYDYVKFVDMRVLLAVAANFITLFIMAPLFKDTEPYNFIVKQASKLGLSTGLFFKLLEEYFSTTQLSIKRLLNVINDRSLKDSWEQIRANLQDYQESLPLIARLFGNTNKPFVSAYLEKIQPTFKNIHTRSWDFVSAMPADIAELIRIALFIDRSFLALLDIALLAEILATNSDNIIIVTGYLHTDALTKILAKSGYKTVYNSGFTLKNGTKIDNLTELIDTLNLENDNPLEVTRGIANKIVPLSDKILSYTLLNTQQLTKKLKDEL